MPGSTLSFHGELEEFQAALRDGAQVELLATGRGQFQSQMARISLLRVCVLWAEESLPIAGFVTPRANSVIVVLPLASEPAQVWAGVPLEAGELITIKTGPGFHVRATGSRRTGVISIPSRDLDWHGRTIIGGEFAVPAGAQRWRPARASLRSLIRLYNAAFRVTTAKPGVPRSADAARGLEQQLIEVLAECLSGGEARRNSIALRRHMDIMGRLEDLLRAHPTQLPTQAGLSAELGVSTRTLWTCCHEYLGMGLGRYLHLRRMQQIHRALRNADSSSCTVSEIARRHGVGDLGRFAGTYRDLFGELPSATLQRTLDHPIKMR
jgi:AraC-like DNA-binding protein